MAIPLIVLAIGSIAAGYVGVPGVLFGANRIQHFLAPSFQASSAGQLAAEAAGESSAQGHAGQELTLMLLASAIALAGIGLAARIYLKRPEIAANLAARFPGVYRFLLNKGYVDEVYNEAIVQPIKALSEGALWHGLDATVIDGAVNGTGLIVTESGSMVRRVQTGSVRAYAVSVLFGALCWWLGITYGDSVPLLTILVVLPLAGLLAIALIDRRHEAVIRTMALTVSVLVFAVTLAIWWRFNAAASAPFNSPSVTPGFPRSASTTRWASTASACSWSS